MKTIILYVFKLCLSIHHMGPGNMYSRLLSTNDNFLTTVYHHVDS